MAINNLQNQDLVFKIYCYNIIATKVGIVTLRYMFMQMYITSTALNLLSQALLAVTFNRAVVPKAVLINTEMTTDMGS